MEEKEEEDRIGAGGRGGHAVKGQPELSEEERALQMKVMEHQRGAARLSQAAPAAAEAAPRGGGAPAAPPAAAAAKKKRGRAAPPAAEESLASQRPRRGRQ